MFCCPLEACDHIDLYFLTVVCEIIAKLICVLIITFSHLRFTNALKNDQNKCFHPNRATTSILLESHSWAPPAMDRSNTALLLVMTLPG